MTRFSVQTEKEGNKKFFYILDQNQMEPELLSSQYLMHKIRSNRSPNTVRRAAFAINYYLEFLEERQKRITEVLEMPFDEQNTHFIDFS